MAGMLAMSNVGRAAAFRSGYFLRNVVPVWINGAARSGVIQQSIRIDLNTGDEPHRASFDLRGGHGFIPRAGQTCVIGHGSTAQPLFSGRLLKVARSTTRNADTRPVYRCEAAGWAFDLGLVRVEDAVSVTSLAPRSIVGAMLPPSYLTFTYNNVSPDLPYVAEFSTGPAEPVPQALSRMFRSIDAKWFIDHNKDIHAFLTFDRAAGGTATTLTSQTDAHWGLVYDPTDLSRAYRAVQVIGAGQATLADVDTTYHDAFPLPSAQGLYDESTVGEPSSLGQFGTADNVGHLVGIEGRNRFATPPIDRFQTPVSHLRVKRVSTFLPMSPNANTLTVAAENIASMSPLHDRRWYGIAGQWIYVASTVGAYSLTASSVAYSYWVPSSISGAVEADIQPATDIAPTWNFVPSAEAFRVQKFAAGTQIRTFAYVEGNAAVNSLATDLGDLTDSYYWVRTIDDDRLSPSGARQVASEALARGTVTAWQSLEFTTRDPYADIGRPIYVSVTSLAETGAASIVGTFAAHDVSIGGFGRLSETRGPERTVRAGSVRRPTLWQVLQGDN